MRETDVLIGTLMDGACLNFDELTSTCTVEQEWLLQRIEEGLLPVSGNNVTEWRFTTTTITRVRRMREIERNFEAKPELAALVADMLEELDTLREQVQHSQR